MKITAVKATSHLVQLTARGHVEKEPQRENVVCVRIETDEAVSASSAPGQRQGSGGFSVPAPATW